MPSLVDDPHDHDGQVVLDATVHRDVPEMIYSQVGSAVKKIHWFEHSRHCVMIDDEWEQVAVLTLEFLEQVGRGTAT